MNVYRITKAVTISVPGVIPKAYQSGDLVPPHSPYYWAVVWSGSAEDTGTSQTVADEPVFSYSRVVMSPIDPELAEEGLWVQTFPGTDDYTIWIEDGK